jgi:hypothetical protein
MAVNLSPYGGVGAQFLDNAGNVLTGGKIFTYAAGTTTNQATYTSSTGTTFHPNPIILDAAGRVPSGGEIWLTDGLLYKFVLETSTGVLIATYDNITGINSNFVNFTNEQEIQTATAGQTVFNLATMSYLPGTNSLSVFVDGVNQYGPGAQYAYLETDSNTVTFVNGLHVGALVKFTASQLNSSAATDASQVSYTPPFTGSAATNVEDKLAQTISVKDFGAVGDGVTNDTAAFQAALNSVEGAVVRGVAGEVYYIPTTVYCLTDGVTLDLLGSSITTDNFQLPVFSLADPSNTSIATDNVTFRNVTAVQTATVVDISGSTFYPAPQPENWKVAGLIHRGKSIGKTLTVENVSGDNFINLVSNIGDWQDLTLPSGPLIMRNIKTSRINFGLLDNGSDYLEVNGWDDDDRVAIQIAGGGIMPPHTVYTYAGGQNHQCQSSNYFIRNVNDRNTVHGSCLKLRQVDKFQIANVVGVQSPAIVEILNGSNGAVIGCNLSDPTDDPALTFSQSAYWSVGCQNVSWTGCNADCIAERKLIRVQDSNESGSLVSTSGVYFEGNANFLGDSYAIAMPSGGGVSFNISMTSSVAGTFGIFRDAGAGSPALGDVIVNVKSVLADSASTLVLYFLNAAGGAKVFYTPTSLVNITSVITAGTISNATAYLTPTGIFTGEANQNIDLLAAPTGINEFVASNTTNARRGVIRYEHTSNKWVFVTNGAIRGEWGLEGLRYLLNSSLTLSTDNQFTIERASDTQVNLVYRGTDGVTRRAAITVS